MRYEWRVIGLEDQLDVEVEVRDQEQAFLLIPAGTLDGRQGYQIEVKVTGTGKFCSVMALLFFYFKDL